MKSKHLLSLFAAALALWAAATMCAAEPARPLVSPAFGDHMVLQRDRINRIWGWAAPGAVVRVTVGGFAAQATAGADGAWRADFAPPPAGGPYTVRVEAVGAAAVELQDVLVGDVWLCGGQSNMEMALAYSKDGAAAVKAADHPTIRFIRVAQQSAYGDGALPQGTWKVCTPETAGADRLSGVAYYFARRLQRETGVPIGLVQDCVGGTPAETWMSPAALKDFPEFAPALTEMERLRQRGVVAYGNFIMHWYDEFDRGLAGQTWAAEAFDDSAWTKVPVPGAWTELGAGAGPAVYWLRRDVVLPDPLPAGAAKILLGVVEKMDTTHINGRWIGASSWVENPRAYFIPEGVLRPGRNQVTVRVFKVKPDGGFQSPADALKIQLGDGTTVPLAGEWKAALSVDARPPHPMPIGFENYPTMPAVLHLGMLKPFAPMALRGVIWYQGEANQFKAQQYRKLLPAMIADWRATFGQPDLPFLIAGLPVFMGRKAEAGATDGWTGVREAQSLAARTLPHTGLAVTVDTGEAGDIHPKDKEPVGERLALQALRIAYGRPIVASGPSFARLAIEGAVARIHFSNVDGGLMVKGDRLGEFAIAGADRKWHWAEARIEGDTVIVSSPAVPQPVAVRYAWQANPLATLYNLAGLPAEPFRTDDW